MSVVNQVDSAFFSIISGVLVKLDQMLRPFLLVLLMMFCPALAWAQDDFCGPVRVKHACPMHQDQVCQCQDHEFCLRLAAENPGPSLPSPPRCEVVCPLQPVVTLRPAQRLAPAPPSLPVAPPLCPSLAPEPPPPRV